MRICLNNQPDSELVCKVVRDFILKKNINSLDLKTLDRERDDDSDLSPEQALQHLRSITTDSEKVKSIITEERDILEKFFFNLR